MSTTAAPVQPHQNLCRSQVTILLAVASILLSLGVPAPGQAAWDLRHAAAMEDLLRSYMQSLAGAVGLAPPRLFIYNGTAFSRACPASGISAPAYCPGDHTIYLETGLGDAIAARYGDFGALSILSHEFGHAVMSQLRHHPSGKDGELAADNFAGGFARYAAARGLLEPGDLDEALATFAAVGDHNVYSHDHHGTPAERQSAFEKGYAHGFRLPNDGDSPVPVTPQAPASAPVPPSAPTQSPAPPSPQPVQATPAAALLGLGLGVVAAVAIVAALIALIRKAAEDDE